jgi:(R)-2-hydroxyacyl-CoA dehydratese activating ATPase
MAVAGIDVGSQSTKVVILEGDRILAGIHEWMAARLFGLAQRVGMQPDVVMSGGVGKNNGIIRALEPKLGRPVRVPEEPQIAGAVGAALFALDRIKKKPAITTRW